MTIDALRGRPGTGGSPGRDRRSGTRALGRAGLAARAVVYVVLSFLAFDIAFSGSSPTQASSDGALAEVSRQPAGPFALGLLALGLLCYALWRLVAACGPDGTGEVNAAKRVGWGATAAVYLGLFAQAVRLIGGSGGSGGPSNNPGPYAADVLRSPGGPLWLGLAGAAVAAAGAALAVWGVGHDYRTELTVNGLGARGRAVARALGAFGNLTRGVLVILIGTYLLVGAVNDDPAKVKGLDAVLLTVAHRTAGPALLGLAAAGLLAFGIFSAMEARYRRI